MEPMEPALATDTPDPSDTPALAGRRRRRWGDLSPVQKALVVIAAAVQFAVAAVAVNDLARRPADQVRGPKWAWAPAMAVNFVGPLAYLRWGRIRSSTDTGSGS